MDYTPKGVCSQQIHFDIKDNKVTNVSFRGGCNGNLQGISRLIEGMDVNEAISRIEGIKCGFKATSCPDQLAKALQEALARMEQLIMEEGAFIPIMQNDNVFIYNSRIWLATEEYLPQIGYAVNQCDIVEDPTA